LTSLTKTLADASELVDPQPNLREKVGSLANSLLEKTSRAASKYHQTRGAILGGSFAKGTWLPEEVDIDIFVKFDPATPDDEFERIGLAVGAAATRGYPRGKKFAQHPYTEATVDGIKVNVVPCFDVRDGRWKSAADRSPYHVDLVRVISEETKTQVRILKQFMKAVGVYGAEIQTQGFSGYVAEVLVMKHGSFVDVLKWFSKLVPGDRGRLFALPDPVDEGRDLGVAVSAEKLGVMVLASREFLRRPGLGFFRSMSGKPRPSLRRSVVGVVFTHRSMSEDIVWGELRRTTRHVVKHLEAKGFGVARSLAASNNSDSSAILLIPESLELPHVEQRMGPRVDREKDVGAFISSNRKDSLLVWVDGEARVRLLKPREYVSLTGLLRDIASGKAGHVGASLELEKGMKKGAQVLHGATLARAASKAKWLDKGVREITTDAIGTGPR
jgi:tRNA nucleotidyltransferase (CCA-adding enzyme)